jgi:arylsulfatase A-like enzyme
MKPFCRRAVSNSCNAVRRVRGPCLLWPLLLCLTVLPLSHAYSAPAPNIVFILTDDHRWDALSILDHPMVETPSLDRLCEEGIRFENAFVTTSLCTPSRASFLTGQYAHTHGVKNNLTPWQDDNVTFLELLKKGGYDTAFIGKWHMPGKLPTLRGVDQFVTFTVQGGQGRYFDCPLVVNGRKTPSRKRYITTELTDYALEFISQPRANPFCLYLSHKAVHHQFHPPPEIAGRYGDRKVPIPAEADNWISMNPDLLYCGLLGPLKRTYRNYMETLHATDLETGRLLARLDDLGIADNTIVIYFGDNGFFMGEHRLMDKRWAYEESIRVPCIIKAPGLIDKRGRTAAQMVLNIDVAPTILDLAGLPVPPEMEGSSMTPCLHNEHARGRDAWLYEYFPDFPYRVPGIRAIRTADYKYIEYQNGRPGELYDLKRDPLEQLNRIDLPEERQRITRYKAMIDRLFSGETL